MANEINHPRVSPQEVYRKDYEIVASAKIMIAYVGQPSLGVGTELEIAKNSGTGIILVHHKEDRVSRMAKGNPAVKAVIAYESEEDALDRLRNALRERGEPRA